MTVSYRIWIEGRIAIKKKMKKMDSGEFNMHAKACRHD